MGNCEEVVLEPTVGKLLADRLPTSYQLGLISAALSCLVYPPQEERLDVWKANHVCDINS